VLTFFPKGFVDAQQTLQATGSKISSTSWSNLDDAKTCDGNNASLRVSETSASPKDAGTLTVSSFTSALSSLPDDAIVTNITVSFKATVAGSFSVLEASSLLLKISGIRSMSESFSFSPSGPFSFSLTPQLWGLPHNTNGSDFKAKSFELSLELSAAKITVTINLDCFFFEVIYFVPTTSTATPQVTPKPTPRPTPSSTPLPPGATFGPTPQPSPLPPGATFPPTTSEVVVESTTESLTDPQTPTTVSPADSLPLSTAPAPVTDEGTPFWVWIIVAVVLIACIVAAGFAVVRWRQRNEAQEEPEPEPQAESAADEAATVSVVPKKGKATEVALKEKWLSMMADSEATQAVQGDSNAKPSEAQLFSQLSQYASTSAVTQPVIYSSIRD
jgi:hypothetical protein